MNNNLKKLLSQYEKKRYKAINDLNKRKNKLYKKYPEIEKIDNDISSLSIKKIQLLLISGKKKEINNVNKRIADLQNERMAIIKKLKIPNNFFLPHFECNKCKDTGYVETSNGNVLCSCIKQELYNIEYNNSNIYDLKKQNFENFDLNLYSNSPDFEKYHTDVSPRQNMKSIRKTCNSFIANFESPTENNLLFCGNTGLGKTFLSSCIANEIIRKGKTVLYQTAPLMLDKIIDYKLGKTDINICETIYNVDLLIIDDLGTENKSNFKITELFNIVNSRLLNQNNKITKTIISTNLSLQELYDAYEERIVSRIIGNYNACYFYGDDIRIKKKMTIK